MRSRVILAADELNPAHCFDLILMLGHRLDYIKIHDLYDSLGPSIVQRLRDAGMKVWIDFKLHDVPRAVERRARALAAAGADIVTVHASGEIEMMQAAVKAFPPPGEVFVVTTLSSLDEEQIHLLHGHPSKAAVLRLARLAKLAGGVAGIVCSPKEVGTLARRPELKGMKFLVPGIRLPGQETHDQQRVDTPYNAIKAGATYLVVGDPITKAHDPGAVLDAIEKDIARAEKEMAASHTK